MNTDLFTTYFFYPIKFTGEEKRVSTKVLSIEN